MKAGKTVYFGQTKELRSYFGNLGHSFSDKDNVADVVIDITSQKEADDEERWTTIDFVDDNTPSPSDNGLFLPPSNNQLSITIICGIYNINGDSPIMVFNAIFFFFRCPPFFI